MKEFKTEEIRNIALIGHGSAGKTSLTEAIYFTTGKTSRLGKIDDGTTLLDFTEEEIQRKLTIITAMCNIEYNNRKINILDTPGYIDFTGEVIGALKVVETAVSVVDAVSGVEVGTIKTWEFATKQHLSHIIVVNRMDREHANFDNVLKSIHSRLNDKAVAFAIPIGAGEGFKGIVDLISRKAYMACTDGKAPAAQEPPANMAAQIDEYRSKLVEAAVETDDELMMAYLDGAEIGSDQLLNAIRQGILRGTLIPVVPTNAVNGIGIHYLLNLISEYAPSPADKGTFTVIDGDKEVKLEPSTSGKLAALVFKTVSEKHVGELSYIRAFSGSFKSGDDVYNTTKSATERIGQVLNVNGKNRQEMSQLVAGDICALVKLKNTNTGDTFADKGSSIKFQPIHFPEPLVFSSIACKTKGEEDKMATGLSRLKDEDPAFQWRVDPVVKQTIIAGQGEMHLEIMIKRLRERFGVEVETSRPKVPYRETITGTSKVQGRYKKQTGGRGQFGDVWIEFSPLVRGAGVEFEDAIVGGVVPRNFIPAVEKGVREASESGILAGFPTVDFHAKLYFGSHHPVDSSEMAFKVAGGMAFRKGIEEAKPILLEPVYAVEVVVPEEYMGDIMGDISSRRGKVQGMEPKGTFQIIKGNIPMSELWTYSTDLRSMTQGRAFYTQKFSHYDPVPFEFAQRIIEENKREFVEE